jgi:nucleoside-diphosphate-sugar epimerase
MNKVVITGANGFLGSFLCNYFQKKNWNVTALAHRFPLGNSAPQEESGGKVRYHLFNLSQPPDEEILENTDCLIHCAYAKASKGSTNFSLNAEGTKRLLQLSRNCGVKKNIFISSLASQEDALSVYGRQKYACEQFFRQPGDLILRPGLIIGNGGLYGQMRSYLKKSRFLPLISGGTQAMQTIQINELANTIELCIQNNVSGTFSLASTEKLTYKEFYRILCSNLQVKPVFISIPYSILYAFLSLSETLKIPLPVNRENLLGLKKMTYINTGADLAKMGIQLKSFKEQFTVDNEQ